MFCNSLFSQQKNSIKSIVLALIICTHIPFIYSFNIDTQTILKEASAVSITAIAHISHEATKLLMQTSFAGLFVASGFIVKKGINESNNALIAKGTACMVGSGIGFLCSPKINDCLFPINEGSQL